MQYSIYRIINISGGVCMSSVYPPFGNPPAQRCQRCGTPLVPNVLTCVNCGAFNPVAQPGGSAEQGQPFWGGSPLQPSQTPFGSGQYQGSQWGQPSVPPSQNNQWRHPQPPTFPPDNTFGAPYMPQQLSTPNNFYGMPGQNMYYSSPSAIYDGYSPADLNGYAPSRFDLPPKNKRGPRVGLIAGIALMVIILIGGAFGGYVYLKSHNQNNTAANATPTELSTPTVTPLFSDSFGNNKYGWDLTSNPGKFSVKVGNGSMVLEDDDNKLLWEILPGKRFTDFRLDVNATLSKGDPTNGYGVFIRGASSQDSDIGTYYRFELYGDGTYAIFKGSLDATGQTQSTKVRGYAKNDAIAKAGQVNHLTIIAKGPVMTLMINGQTVYTYTDDNYKSGTIAMFVSNLPSQPPVAQAIFTNLAIFPAS
jgi:hypothetical protein